MAPGGYDALAGVATPFLIIDCSHPGMVDRALLNTAAVRHFLGLRSPGRWTDVPVGDLQSAGLDAKAWASWDWAGAPPPETIDCRAGPPDTSAWWRLTFSLAQEAGPLRLVVSAAPVDDLHAEGAAAGDAGSVIEEIEEMAGFGHYAFWPQQRHGLWTGGMARIWTVPEPHSQREFENMVALIHPTDLQARAEGGERATVLTDMQEVRIVRTDGEVRNVRTIGARHVDGQGLVQRVVRIDQDVTELRRAEEELRLAREAAGDAARAKEAFLHLMNHSLRTPLNAILGFGEAMRDQIYGPLSAEYVQSIEAVNDSAQRLLELIDDILDLTRLESGRYSLAKSVCDLDSIIAAVTDLMAPRVTERNLRLAAIPRDGEPVTVWGEERGLRQILVNLLEFATVSAREVHTITLAAGTDGNGQATLSLEDDGGGLRREIEAALRDPLGSGLNTAESGGASSWFGLSLVKSFLQLHGGALQAGETATGHYRIDVTLPR